MRACPKGAILTHADLARLLDAIAYAVEMAGADIRGVEGSTQPYWRKIEREARRREERLLKLQSQIALLAEPSRKPGEATS